MKDWIVVFQNTDTGNVALAEFTESTPEKARKCFWACYRHGNYKILTVLEKPEVTPAKFPKVLL